MLFENMKYKEKRAFKILFIRVCYEILDLKLSFCTEDSP